MSTDMTSEEIREDHSSREVHWLREIAWQLARMNERAEGVTPAFDRRSGLSAEERSARARKAAEARWGKGKTPVP